MHVLCTYNLLVPFIIIRLFDFGMFGAIAAKHGTLIKVGKANFMQHRSEH